MEIKNGAAFLSQREQQETGFGLQLKLDKDMVSNELARCETEFAAYNASRAAQDGPLDFEKECALKANLVGTIRREQIMQRISNYMVKQGQDFGLAS